MLDIDEGGKVSEEEAREHGGESAGTVLPDASTYAGDATSEGVAAGGAGVPQIPGVRELCLEFGVSPELSGEIVLPALVDNLALLMTPVLELVKARACPRDVRHKVEVALEEMLVNVCLYAYAAQGGQGEVRMSYALSTDPYAISVQIVDQGVPFNPLTRKDPTRPSSIQEAKIGGLGIFMTKKSMDRVSYHHDGAQNVFRFTKSW